MPFEPPHHSPRGSQLSLDPNWTFKDYRQHADFSREDCCTLFDVSLTTVKNWEKGKTKTPKSVLVCLLIFNGRLDFLGFHWRGFCIKPDCIESPEGNFIYAQEIQGMNYVYGAAGINRGRVSRTLYKNRYGEVKEKLIINEKFVKPENNPLENIEFLRPKLKSIQK